MSLASPSYVVVEGPIGAGKTSLARRLAAAFGSEVLLEEPEHNPFLERFYQAPRHYALPTQLFFLFQRARQLQALKQGDIFRPVRIADFLLEKDELFARLNLEDDEWRLYEQVYAHMSLDIPIPDLVIYLQAPVDVLLERVRKRGIDYERAIKRDYLERLSESYTRFFTTTARHRSSSSTPRARTSSTMRPIFKHCSISSSACAAVGGTFSIQARFICNAKRAFKDR